MEIPLPTGIKGDSDSPKQREFIKNAYLERGDRPTISPRPGISLLGSFYGRCRGQAKFEGKFYRVSSDKLFEVTFTDPVTTTEIGTIAGTDDCIMVASFTLLLILVKNGDNAGQGIAYVYDGTTLTQITDPLFPPCRSVAFINSRFVFVPTDGGPYFWDDLSTPASVFGKQFADAESLPDKNFQVIEYQDNILIGGGETIERHSYLAEIGSFARIKGATVNHGIVGPYGRWGENIVYIGKYKNGTFSIYVYGSDQPISSKGVDEILNKYTIEQLQNVWVDWFTWLGQPIVCWRLPEETLVYYGAFAVWTSGEVDQWQGQYIVDFAGKPIVGDRLSNRIGSLSSQYNDYGANVWGEVITFIRGEPRSNFVIDRIYAQATTGQSNDLKEIALSVSEDGVHYGPEVWESLGDAGIYNNEVSWGAPIGRFDNHCSIKLRWVTDIKVPVDGISFE